MKICVSSPYPLTEMRGNTVTALRVAGLLCELGHEARASHGYDGEFADACIVLHAVKGAQAVFDFKKAHPKGRVVVLMTGTDLYEFLPRGSEEGMAALREADAIVVMIEQAVESLPEEFREKAVVIRTSLEEMGNRVKAPRTENEGKFVISVIGHLRPVKRPFLVVETLARYPEWKDVEVWQVGSALDEESRATVEEWERKEPRYRWWGGVSPERAHELCALSSLTVNSSISEGGSNAVLEAMAMGVPVLASEIKGNIGILGENYAGYFQKGKLDQKLLRLFNNPAMLGEWKEMAKMRLPLFSRESELASWSELLRRLPNF